MDEIHKSDATPTRSYRCKDDVSWAVETHGIILLNHRMRKTRFLSYPHAAVWDLISRGYTRNKVVRMLSAISSKKIWEAERLLIESLEDLAAAGFLTIGENRG
jgi:hypothetical protein